MQWYQDLYIDPDLGMTGPQIREAFESGQFGSRYVITQAAAGGDQLDIRKAADLERPYVRDADPMIYGIAASKKSSFELLKKMTEECLRERGDADLRSFLSGGGGTERQEGV